MEDKFDEIFGMVDEEVTTLTVAGDGEVSERHRLAVQLHEHIIVQGEIAARALYETCKSIKQMRDEQLFTEFGYESFDDYCIKMLGIRERQAYTYISAYENLGADALKKYGAIGITKLDIISRVDPESRTDILENEDTAGMSVREIRELVEKCKNQGEQISMLVQEISTLKEDADEIDVVDEISDLLREIDDLKSRALTPEQIDRLKSEAAEAAAEKVKEAEKAARAEAEKEAKKKAKEDAEKEREKIRKEVKSETEKAVADAAAAAAEKAKQEAAEDLDVLKAQIAAADERNRELMKKVNMTDSNSAAASIFFNAFNEDYNRLLGVIAKMDAENAEKFYSALRQALKKLLDNIPIFCEDTK